MSEPDTTTQPDQTTTDADADARRKAARKRFWDRVTVVIIISLIATWAVALYFRNELKAEWWAWRLTQAEEVDQRERCMKNLVHLGRSAAPPARDLTREHDVAVRLAGMRVLLSLAKNVETDGDGPWMPPATVARFRELLDDPETEVRFWAIQGVDLAGDEAAGEKLLRIALNAPAGSPLGRLATSALVGLGQKAQWLGRMKKILAESKNPSAIAEAIDRSWSELSDDDLMLLLDLMRDTRVVKYRPTYESVLLTLDPEGELLTGLNEALGGQGEGPSPLPEGVNFEKMTVADYAALRLAQRLGKKDDPLYQFDADAPESEREQVIRRFRKLLATIHA